VSGSGHEHEWVWVRLTAALCPTAERLDDDSQRGLLPQAVIGLSAAIKQVSTLQAVNGPGGSRPAVPVQTYRLTSS
jgi:hypothetical protein